MNLKGWLVPGLIFVGLVIIAISLWSPKDGFMGSMVGSPDESYDGLGSEVVAQLVEKTGDVFLLNHEMPESIQINAKKNLKARDLLRTTENSSAVVEWKNKGRFQLAKNSEILVDQLDNGQYLLVVRSGEVYVERFGENPSFWIRRDGQLLSAAEYVLSKKEYQIKLKEPIPRPDSLNQLTQVDIENLLNSKKNDFFKCYGQVLQRQPQAQGSVLISFTILNHGKTTKVEITRSDISDSQFSSCIVEVVARTQFSPFTGSPITTVFPLKFE